MSEIKMNIKVQPLGDKVIVKPIEEKEVRKNGIIIPDTVKEKPMEGDVVAVGKGRMTDEGKIVPMELKVGDKVLYGKYSGTEVKVEDQEYLWMKEEDVLGIIK